MRRWLLTIAILLILAVIPAATPATATECEFVLGFKTLRDAIPSVVGSCTSGESHNANNGDGLQATTAWHGKGGLLVWRKVDNWTAFTDGANTWINGPNGIQKRANSERFSWEKDPITAPVPTAIPSVPATVIDYTPQCQAAASQTVLSLASQSRISVDTQGALDSETWQCKGMAQLAGTTGIACYVAASQYMVSIVPYVRSPIGAALVGERDRQMVACVNSGGAIQPIPLSPPSSRPSSPPWTSSAVESRIAGDFEGWDGNTVFVLDNDQVWQQTSYGFTYHYAYHPQVLIYPNGGRWWLRVEGVSSTIEVQRLR